MGEASSSGLTITDGSYLKDPGDCIIFGHNNVDFANVTTDLPAGVQKRWARIWQWDPNDGPGTTSGYVDLTFDISDAGGQGDFDPDASGTYVLLVRDTGGSDFALAKAASPSVSGDELTFNMKVNEMGPEFTLGATADSPTALSVLGFSALGPSAGAVAAVSGLFVVLAAGALGVLVCRARR